jgi:peptidyl-prolyl cis-trans isomerase D
MLSAGELAEKLGIRESDVQSIMSASAGTVVDTAIPSGAALLVVKVLESKPQSVKPLEEVRESIAETLTMQKAADMAMEDARKARAAFKDGKPLEGAEVKTSETFGRDGNIAGLEAEPALSQAAFAVPAAGGAWMTEPYRVQEGAVLAGLSSVEAPSDEDWKKSEEDMVARMQNDRAGMAYQTYIAQLGAKASIKMYNSPLLNRKNRQQ